VPAALEIVWSQVLLSKMSYAHNFDGIIKHPEEDPVSLTLN
jgi:hypothetical protein